jgi:TctA family transporter
MLAILGLTMVGSLSGNSLTKGLAAAFGVLLSTMGYAPNGTTPRFAFGETYLFGGLPLVPFVLGLFALPELLVLAVRGGTIAQVEKGVYGGGIMDGVRDAGREWWLGLRCSFIGVYVGMLPGIGGSVVDWIAYGHAVQSTKDSSGFGKGDVRGVIAPEAANNAMKGGSLIPTIAFAIPGNASMAIMLGAFTMHGLEPGMALLTTRLDFTFSLVWMLAIANVVGALLLMLWARQVAKVAFVRPAC